MIDLLAVLCVLHACSNDTLGVLGDECFAWDPTPGAVSYQIGERLDDGAVRGCGSTTGLEFCIEPGGPCDPPGRGSQFVVQACNAEGCGPWSEAIEVLPFICWTADVPADYTVTNVEERPCVEGAPDRPQADEPWNPIPLPTSP